MKILRLEGQNAKRLRAVDLTPNEDVTFIAGTNASGKSSAMQLVEWVMRGPRAAAVTEANPFVRQGELEARGRLTLGDDGKPSYFVERVCTHDPATGKEEHALKVRETEDGPPLPKPQSILDALVGDGLCLRPFSFDDLERREQVDTVKRLAGLDFKALDAKHAQLYAKRTAVNHVVDAASARAKSMPNVAPTKRVDVGAVLKEVSKLEAEVKATSKLEALRDTAQQGVERAQSEVKHLETSLADMQRRLGEANAKVLHEKERLQNAEDDIEMRPDYSARLDVARKAVAEASTTNDRAQAYEARESALAEAKAKQAESEKLTMELNAIEQNKADMLATAKYPIRGLGFTSQDGEDVLTFDGLPISQASKAQRVRVLMAIAVALNPKFRAVLIEDGNVLDASSREMVRELAREQKVQVLVEWVTEPGESAPDGGVLIVDGGMLSSDA